MSDPKQPAIPSAADFTTRDPGNASFWDERFERGVTPWEFGGVPEGFSVFAHRLEPCAVLIPAAAVRRKPGGWPKPAGPCVRSISPRRRWRPRRRSSARMDVVEQADFFAYRPPFDVQWVYERAFLCALPPPCVPAMRRAWPSCCLLTDCWPAISS